MIVFSGGGTGGHIYPALEIARMASDEGVDLCYVGSFRGQEGKVCQNEGIPFYGLPSQPLWSLKTPRGWSSLIKLLQATTLAKKRLRHLKPSVIFSTGGYSAAPVMYASRALQIPLIVHEANSIPGRSNLMFAKRAHKFNCVFKKTLSIVPTAVRLGQPIRRELRSQALEADGQSRQGILVVGGSQGSGFLNERVPEALASMTPPPAATIVTGKGAKTPSADGQLTSYVEFLEAQQMASAYASAEIVIGRSGGSLAEFAAFRLPSILVPYPYAAGQHQLHNAMEFAEMGAARVLQQEEADSKDIREAIEYWLSPGESVSSAKKALAEWDCPHANTDLWNLVKGAAN